MNDYDGLYALFARMRDEGTILSPGLDDSDLHEFEATHQIKIPDDMRAFKKLTDGPDLAVNSEDKSQMGYWPLREWTVLANGLVEFADYFYWCWSYAFVADPSSEIFGAIIRMPEDFKVASSFAEFAKRMVDDEDSMLFVEDPRSQS